MYIQSQSELTLIFERVFRLPKAKRVRKPGLIPIGTLLYEVGKEVGKKNQVCM